MLFFVLLVVGAATAAPTPKLYLLTEPTPLGSYVVVEPLPEAPIFPSIHYDIASQDKKGIQVVVPAERRVAVEDDGNKAKPEELETTPLGDEADNAKPEEDTDKDANFGPDDANNAKPEEGNTNDAKPDEDDGNDAKPEEDSANDAKPEASEAGKPIPHDEIKISPPSEHVVIRVEDPKASIFSWLPPISSVPILSSLNLNLPSLSDLNISNLTNFLNLPSWSSIWGSSPTGSRYIVYRPY